MERVPVATEVVALTTPVIEPVAGLAAAISDPVVQTRSVATHHKPTVTEPLVITVAQSQSKCEYLLLWACSPDKFEEASSRKNE
jgi:hypothetical protein